MTAPRRIRRPIRRPLAAALAVAAATLLLSGCLEYEEDICNSGEYPVLSVGGTGSACVKDGKEPDPGWARHPEGKVPLKVDDKWDVYWRTHTLDKNGKIIDAPKS
ncbi:SCO0607 family lipoprotein [Streptomyces sp. NPDC048604]|uniref:SCO0607 family lipoprotein n=1 Tax=Streptomyces sp. NPDC048604 TaxID=3365578 RepID=UPI003713EDF3